jgi:hypothetical protein
MNLSSGTEGKIVDDFESTDAMEPQGGMLPFDRVW